MPPELPATAPSLDKRLEIIDALILRVGSVILTARMQVRAAQARLDAAEALDAEMKRFREETLGA